MRMLACLLFLCLGLSTAKADLIGDVKLFSPAAPPLGVVFLFSDSPGWTDKEQKAAEAIVKTGKAAIGIDLATMLRNIAQSDDSCALLIGEIENASHEAQKELKAAAYRFPILAGFGQGGQLALDMAGQLDVAVVERIIAVNPDPAFAPAKKLCGTDRSFPVPVLALFSGPNESAKINAANDLQRRRPELEIAKSDLSLTDALLEALRPKKPAAPPDLSKTLPLIELPVSAPPGQFAIFYSGDGGWRDLDRDLAAILQKEGTPVVGVDCLRYFWTALKPQQVADDLSRMIAFYGEKWGTSRVLLIGYSFGADILPIAINLLPPQDQEKIAQISLLGFAQKARFEITLSGWLNLGDGDALPTMEDVRKLPPRKLQCFFGADDKEDACKLLQGGEVEIIGTTGGHHFDGDYAALARRILEGASRREQ